MHFFNAFNVTPALDKNLHSATLQLPNGLSADFLLFRYGNTETIVALKPSLFFPETRLSTAFTPHKDQKTWDLHLPADPYTRHVLRAIDPPADPTRLTLSNGTHYAVTCFPSSPWE
jgi:hypothetical protein